MEERYIIDDSDKFRCMCSGDIDVIDTTRKDTTGSPFVMCSCYEKEEAELIAKALNALNSKVVHEYSLGL